MSNSNVNYARQQACAKRQQFTTDGTERPAFRRARGDQKRLPAADSLERLAIRCASSSRAMVRERSGVV